MMIVGDYYTIQYIGDGNNAMEESLLPNQYNGMIEGFEHCSTGKTRDNGKKHGKTMGDNRKNHDKFMCLEGIETSI